MSSGSRPAARQPRPRWWSGPLLTLATVGLAEGFAFLLPPEAQPFHRAGFLPVLAALIVAAWRGGLRAALLSGLLGAAGIVHLFLVFGGPLGPPPVRLVVGGTIAAFGVALASLIGHLRDRERRAVDALMRERESLTAANRELAAANASLRDFSHVVAHDLRNPVRGISTLAAYLGKDLAPRLDETQRSDMALLLRETERLSTLLEALLDYSRATRFDPDDLRPLHVQELLQTDACQTRFASLARERRARVVPPSPESPSVRANPGALSLILGNLVTNAIRHNDKPEPLVRVEVRRCAEKEGHVEVLVEDDGPGFSPEGRARLEEAFAGRADPQVGRNGFGLVIVSRAAERMGGEVRIGTSPEGGAAVRVILPDRGAPRAEDEAPAGPRG